MCDSPPFNIYFILLLTENKSESTLKKGILWQILHVSHTGILADLLNISFNSLAQSTTTIIVDKNAKTIHMLQHLLNDCYRQH